MLFLFKEDQNTWRNFSVFGLFVNLHNILLKNSVFSIEAKHLCGALFNIVIDHTILSHIRSAAVSFPSVVLLMMSNVKF